MNRFASSALLAVLAAPALAQPRTDAYGDPLPEGALARFGSLRFRTGWSDPVHIVPDWALSPDGKTLAIGIGGDLTLWDIDSGRAVLRVAPAESAILSVAFSPDGKHLVRVDRVKVALFDAATGRERHAWDLVEPQAVAFLPGSSRFVVTVRRQAYAHVFDAKRAVELPPWKVESPIVSLSPPGRSFLGDSDARLYLVDTRTGRVRCRFPVTTDPETFGGAAYASEQQSALSPDDRRLYLVRPTGDFADLRRDDRPQARRVGPAARLGGIRLPGPHRRVAGRGRRVRLQARRSDPPAGPPGREMARPAAGHAGRPADPAPGREAPAADRRRRGPPALRPEDPA